MTATLNQIPNEPTLADLLAELKKDIFLSLNCHHIGTIQSFDPDTQTVTATINYKRTFMQPAANGIYQPVLKDYPILEDIPAIILGGGTASLTFPIAPKDECLILFSDRDMDNWFAGGGVAAPATGRLHSFSDAIAIVGLRSKARSLDNYDTLRTVLQNQNAMVGVGPNLVKIANNITTLNTLLQNLVSAIKGLKIDLAGVTAGGSTVPLGGTVDATSLTTLTSIADQISELLE